MIVRVWGRDGTNILIPQGVQLRPVRYRFEAQGGPRYAEIAGYGDAAQLAALLAWLRYDVEIQDDYGTALWWGYANGVSAGRLTVSLDDMANRIAVIWSGDDDGGVTAWAEDADSIANYGTKELLVPVDGVDENGAEAQRDWLLGQLRFPTARVQAAQEHATLLCYGEFTRLRWTYHDRDEGLVEHAPGGGVAQKVGWGFTSSEVGFTARWYAVAELHNRGNELEKGEKVAVTGSASNDGALTVESTSQRERQTYTATSIAFLGEVGTATNEYIRASHDVARKLNNDNLQASTVVVEPYGGGTPYVETTDYTIDYVNGKITALSTGAIANNEQLGVDYQYIEYRIEDANIGLGFGNAGDIVEVSGSGSNDGYYRVLSSGADGDRLTVKEAVVDEGPGASVTVARGSNVTVAEILTAELPGASVTVTGWGSRVVQSFTIPSDAAWTANQIQVRARKRGNPGDDLRLGIRADSTGTPGSFLESVDVPATDVDVQFSWVVGQLLNTLSLAVGTTYWLSVGRSGAVDPDNYYEVAVDEDLGYVDGGLKLWDGAAYQDRPVDGDLIFRITGAEETTTQIETLVAQHAQFLAGTDTLDASGLESLQYRAGRTTAQTELLDLLEVGTTNARRLLASVTRERILHVVEEPAQPAQPDYVQDPRGNVHTRVGGRLPVGDMRFVGQWVAVTGLPPTADFTYINSPSPFLVEAAEFDVERGQYNVIEPAGSRPAWRAGMSIDEG